MFIQIQDFKTEFLVDEPELIPTIQFLVIQINIHYAEDRIES